MNRPYKGYVSWVQMELYHLGELPQKEAAHVAAYLNTTSSPDFMDVYIRNDKRPMPPLQIDALLNSAPSFWSILKKPTMALAAAAVALLFVLFLPDAKQTERSRRPATIRIKGGDLALSITRNREGLITEQPKTYKDGDLFKVRLTSSAIEPLFAELFVYQGDEIFFPYDDVIEIRSGNRISLPKAIELTGENAVQICVFISDSMPSRRTLRNMKLSSDIDHVACVSLNEHKTKEQ